jgi:hypothetical protein
MSEPTLKKPGRFFSTADVFVHFFPSKSERWVRETFKSGELGPVLRDSAGWFISEAAILFYQQQHLVNLDKAVLLRSSQENFGR